MKSIALHMFVACASSLALNVGCTTVEDEQGAAAGAISEPPSRTQAWSKDRSKTIDRPSQQARSVWNSFGEFKRMTPKPDTKPMESHWTCGVLKKIVVDRRETDEAIEKTQKPDVSYRLTNAQARYYLPEFTYQQNDPEDLQLFVMGTTFAAGSHYPAKESYLDNILDGGEKVCALVEGVSVRDGRVLASAPTLCRWNGVVEGPDAYKPSKDCPKIDGWF